MTRRDTGSRRPLRRALIAALATLCSITAAGASATAARARGLETGFTDNAVFQSSDAALRATWLQRAVSVGAGIVRLNLFWPAIAPAHPTPAFDPTSPSDPQYNWTGADAAVRDAAAHGLAILLTVLAAPSWAEGAGRAADAPAGTWRPDPAKLADFARAAATRYSGAFPDPTGGSLPRVRYWQAWNEPNLSTYLTPQWTFERHRWTAASAIEYRAMLNAFYGAIKKVASDNEVVVAGTGPYGDPPGGPRVPPVQFLDTLLCLDSRGVRPQACSNPVHFDIFDHHPYGVGGPLWHARNAYDVAVPDLARLTRPLHAALRAGTLLPRVRKPIWITEVSWDSSPPDPEGVPEPMHAQWIEQAFWELWREGAEAIFNYNIRDEPPIPSYAATYQSGMFLLDGTPKLDVAAFSFPFVAHRRARTSVELWGKAPAPGRVIVERQRAGGWQTVTTLRPDRARIFTGRLRLGGPAVLRARSGAQISLPWTQR